jgi:hypothetical protein
LLSTCHILEYVRSDLLKRETDCDDIIKQSIIGAIFSSLHHYETNTIEVVNQREGIKAYHFNDKMIVELLHDTVSDKNNTSALNVHWRPTEITIFESSQSINYKCVSQLIHDIAINTLNTQVNIYNPQAFFTILSKIKIPHRLTVEVRELARNIVFYYSSSFTGLFIKDDEGPFLNENEIYDYLWQYFCSYIIFRIYFNHNKKKSFCISQFPYSPLEYGMLMAAKKCGCHRWFVPHGLPQYSMYFHEFDIVSPLTLMDHAWRKFDASLLYLPWSESQSLKISKPRVRVRRHGLRIVFISQFSGAKLHRVDSLCTSAIDFINLILSRSDIENVKIRFRTDKEREKYYPNINSNSKLSYSVSTNIDFVSDVEGADCIASCSSTALLYAQALNLPSIQVLDKKIESVWPYNLTGEDRIVHVDGTEELSIQISNVLHSVKSMPMNNRILYRRSISGKFLNNFFSTFTRLYN